MPKFAETATIVDFADRSSLVCLADALRKLERDGQIEILARVCANDLFHVIDAQTDLSANGMASAVSALKGDGPDSEIVRKTVFFRTFLKQVTATVDPDFHAFDAFLNHLVDGQDAVDPRSAGGFNADEIDKLCNILQVAGLAFAAAPVPEKTAGYRADLEGKPVFAGETDGIEASYPQPRNRP